MDDVMRGFAAAWRRSENARVEGERRGAEKAANPLGPACTPKEWRDRLSGRTETIRCSDDSELVDCHREAAFALWEQPFGFTHEHAAKMREAVNAAFLNFPPHLDHLLGAMQEIEARIAALLPPESTP